MGRQEVLEILKKNEDVFLSAENICKLANTSRRAIFRDLKNLVTDGMVETKTVLNSDNITMKLYKLADGDEDISLILKQADGSRTRFSHMNVESRLLVYVLDELRKLRRAFEDERRK